MEQCQSQDHLSSSLLMLGELLVSQETQDQLLGVQPDPDQRPGHQRSLQWW